MMKKGVRYEDCNGRAGGNKKAAAARGKVFAAGRNDKKNDKKIER